MEEGALVACKSIVRQGAFPIGKPTPKLGEQLQFRSPRFSWRLLQIASKVTTLEAEHHEIDISATGNGSSMRMGTSLSTQIQSHATSQPQRAALLRVLRPGSYKSAPLCSQSVPREIYFLFAKCYPACLPSSSSESAKRSFQFFNRMACDAALDFDGHRCIGPRSTTSCWSTRYIRR